MKTFRTPQWLWMGGWLAATAILWSISFVTLSELVYRPLPPAGVPANQLRMKLQLLEQRLAASVVRNGGEVLRNATVFLALPADESNLPRPENATIDDPESPKSAAAVSLPRLSGILRTANLQGQEQFLALFEGHVYSLRERLHGLVIEKISAEGVLLSRDGRRWFIPAPEVYFSIQRTP